MTKKGENILETINGYLSDWVAEKFDMDVEFRCDLDFALHFTDDGEEVIGWSLFENGNVSDVWQTYMRKYLKVDMPANLMWAASICHEVGHIMTIDNFSEEELLADIAKKNDLNKIADDYERNITYFDLPIERAATNWMIDYIMDNFDDVWDMQLTVMELLARFYDVEGVEDDD